MAGWHRSVVLVVVLVTVAAGCGNAEQQEPPEDVAAPQGIMQQVTTEPDATDTAEPTAEPTDEPTEIPATEVPPTEAPPTELPPTELPPTAAPPTEPPPPTAPPPTEPAGPPPGLEGCVNINTASFEELRLIKHIDEERAQDIIQLREQRPFRSVDEMTRINGIAAGRLADIKAEGIACVW